MVETIRRLNYNYSNYTQLCQPLREMLKKGKKCIQAVNSQLKKVKGVVLTHFQGINLLCILCLGPMLHCGGRSNSNGIRL